MKKACYTLVIFGLGVFTILISQFWFDWSVSRNSVYTTSNTTYLAHTVIFINTGIGINMASTNGAILSHNTFHFVDILPRYPRTFISGNMSGNGNNIEPPKVVPAKVIQLFGKILVSY